MQFVITAYDGPDMLEKRMEVRERHLPADCWMRKEK